MIYAKAEQRVTAAAKKRKDSTKDLELLARYKGEYPPSLLRVMSGEILSEGVGFHQIAMQVAITSNALGKREEEMLALCEGLLQNHVSDGTRYNTPAKRRTELVRMFRYTQDNVCYTYSRDAVRKLVPATQPSPDLDGLPASAGAITGQADNGNDDGLLGGVFLTEAGIFRRTEDGVLKLSDVSFKDITMLKDARIEAAAPYDADALLDGLSKEYRLITPGGEDRTLAWHDCIITSGLPSLHHLVRAARAARYLMPSREAVPPQNHGIAVLNLRAGRRRRLRLHK